VTSLLAVSTAEAVLAFIGLALGLVVAVVVVLLFNRVVIPAFEIRRYAEDIRDAGVGTAKNLDDADALMRTRELATAVPPLAVAYLEKVKARS
jgi:hypothetical protein